ncbi:hypothetical protein RUM43_009411 [Polyplax serrata]|uniref:Uncharacterized protein n=1 Tax=Polyplax serrata TaxID=468196 RepID=A0AAN8P8C6_POLSC
MALLFSLGSSSMRNRGRALLSVLLRILQMRTTEWWFLLKSAFFISSERVFGWRFRSIAFEVSFAFAREKEFFAILSTKDNRGLMFLTPHIKIGGGLGVRDSTGDSVDSSSRVDKRANLFIPTTFGKPKKKKIAMDGFLRLGEVLEDLRLVANADDGLVKVAANSRRKLEEKGQQIMRRVETSAACSKLWIAGGKTQGLLLKEKLDEERPPRISLAG